MPAISDVEEWSHAVFFSSIAVIRAAGHGQMESGIDRRLLAVVAGDGSTPGIDPMPPVASGSFWAASGCVA
jgi:hypothetical protein